FIGERKVAVDRVDAVDLDSDVVSDAADMEIIEVRVFIKSGDFGLRRSHSQRVEVGLGQKTTGRKPKSRGIDLALRPHHRELVGFCDVRANLNSLVAVAVLASNLNLKVKISERFLAEEERMGGPARRTSADNGGVLDMPVAR